VQLAGIIRAMTAKIKAGNFRPDNAIDRLLFRAFNTGGVRLPINARSIYGLLFNQIQVIEQSANPSKKAIITVT
jgi:hypothetical protein